MATRKLSKHFIESSTMYVFTSDDLKNLPPRNIFKDRLIQSIAFARRYGYKVGLIAIDLNTFDEQTMRSAMNDKLFKLIGERILDLLRQTDTISSQGIDEFLIILPDIPHEGNELLVAQKIYTALRKPFKIQGHYVQLDPYLGVTMYPDDSLLPDELLIQANIAMIEAKNKNIPILRIQKAASQNTEKNDSINQN